MLMLENLTVFGTDEETAIYNGILSECTAGAVHFLSEEHIKANIEKKMEDLKFPNASMQCIITDVFGSPSAESNQCLCH